MIVAILLFNLVEQCGAWTAYAPRAERYRHVDLEVAVRGEAPDVHDNAGWSPGWSPRLTATHLAARRAPPFVCACEAERYQVRVRERAARLRTRESSVSP